MPVLTQNISPSIPALRVNDLRFINAYEVYGFQSPHHIDAYREIFPNCKRASARIGAERLLHRVSVEQEIAHRINATQVLTRDSLASDLVKYRGWAEKANDYTAATSIAIDTAKLLGMYVSKTEVTTVSDAVELKIRRAAVAAMHTDN